MLIWIIVFLIMVLVFWILYLQFYKRKSKFTIRPIQSVHNWYNSYYKDIGISIEFAQQACGPLAEDIGIHMTQIYPTDRIDEDILFHEWWGFGRYADEICRFDRWLEMFLEDKNIKKYNFSSLTIGDLLLEIDKLAKSNARIKGVRNLF